MKFVSFDVFDRTTIVALLVALAARTARRVTLPAGNPDVALAVSVTRR